MNTIKWPPAIPAPMDKNPFLPMTPTELLLIRLDIWTRKRPNANRLVRWLWTRFITPSPFGRDS